MPKSERQIPNSQKAEMYAWLVDSLPISQDHVEHLRGPKRRLSREQIRRRAYVSWPDDASRNALAKDLKEHFGVAVRGLPGYFMAPSGESCLIGPAGLLLPVRDFEGRIGGLQIRPDDEALPKRLWLSSQGRRHGGRSGAPAHVSLPRTTEHADLYIVEGVLNADICSDWLRAPVLGVAGKAGWRQVDFGRLIAQLSVSVVVIALDEDWDDATQPERLALAEALQPLAETRIARWDSTKAKGLDDCLLTLGYFELV
jgi:hypothetical protein